MIKLKKLDESAKSMIQSCYTYGELNSRYIDEKRAKFGDKLVNDYIKLLQDKYSIATNTYTDIEGCTYNSLIIKQ